MPNYTISEDKRAAIGMKRMKETEKQKRMSGDIWCGERVKFSTLH